MKLSKYIEKYRVKSGFYKSVEGMKSGVFAIPCKLTNKKLSVIASDGEGWEHVSVSLKSRSPLWHEMNYIKGLFWDDDEVVIQYHPKKSEYVNNHNYCLHLWKPIDVELPEPPSILVGIK